MDYLLEKSKSSLQPSRVEEKSLQQPLEVEEKFDVNKTFIKVDADVLATSSSFTQEIDPSITIKIANKRQFMKPETISFPDPSARYNNLKEKGNEESLLSDLSGSLTPFLKCSMSDMDDTFLTTFVNTPKTPKSGAAGYGLGMDIEDLFAGSSLDL